MAYVSRPRGFQLRSAREDVRIMAYATETTDAAPLGLGDPVKASTNGVVVIDGDYLQVVTRAAAGDRLKGIVVGVDPYRGRAEADINLSLKHRPASKACVVYVCDDVEAIYEVQLSAAGVAAEVGNNMNQITAVDCDLVTGISKAQLDEATATTSSAQFRYIGIVNRPDNLDLTTNVSVLVRINDHEDKTTSGV